MNRRRNEENELFMPLFVALLAITANNSGIIIIMFLNIISSVSEELRLSIGVTVGVGAIDTLQQLCRTRTYRHEYGRCHSSDMGDQQDSVRNSITAGMLIYADF